MSPRARSILRWMFIIVFLIIAPVIILSTTGYRYNFTKRRLERTGVLVVDSRPADAAVLLNDRPAGGTTPARIDGLLPGTYQVRIEKPGYWPWNEEAEIVSNTSTFLNGVTLFRQDVPILDLELPAEAVSFSPDGRFAAALSLREPWKELRLFDFKKSVGVLPYRAQATKDGRFAFAWSSDSRRLLISRREESKSSFLLWDSARPDEMLDLAAVAGRNLDQAFWSEDGLTLYAADKSRLYEVDPLTRFTQDAGPSADAMTVSNDEAYGLRAADGGGLNVVRRQIDGALFEKIAEAPAGSYLPIRGSGRLLGYVSDAGQRLLLVDPGKTGDRAIAFEGVAAKAAWSPDGKRLLYWNDLELHVYDASQGSDDLITRLGSPLREAQWYAGGSVILLADARRLTAIQTGRAPDRTTIPLAAFTNLADFSVNKTGDAVRFAGTIGRQTGLWSLKLK